MDEFEISRLVYQCAEYFDKGDIDSAANLFRNATVVRHDGGPALNYRELLAAWRKECDPEQLGMPVTRQLISNPIILVNRASGTASCRSLYTLIDTSKPHNFAICGTGQYDDEFILSDAGWQFASRRCSILTAHPPSDDAAKADTQRLENRNGSLPTKARIIEAAQHIFSTVGYSEAGIRKIAELVDLSPTILFRHFGTKAGLYEAALIAAMGEPKPPSKREHFGRHIAKQLADPAQINCPHAMTVLATGNEEAREIAIRVLREHALMPMMAWLGPPNAESRSRAILALCAGFVLQNAQLNVSSSKTPDPYMVKWLAKSIQAIVDQS